MGEIAIFFAVNLKLSDHDHLVICPCHTRCGCPYIYEYTGAQCVMGHTERRDKSAEDWR